MDIHDDGGNYMICPICGKEMQEGGIVADDVVVGWVPMEQFKRKGLARLTYSGVRTIGISNVLLGQTRIPNAFLCEDCNKIVGVFDITNKIER